MANMFARRAKLRGSKLLNFRCTECGNCCSDTIVPVSHQDVERLMKGTGLPASKIARFFKTSDFDDKGDGLQLINMDGGRRILGLQKRFDKPNKRDACKFFLNGRCSVYESRPVTCRVWPFTLVLDEGGALRGMSINPSLPCPYELDGKNRPKDIKKDWDWDDKQDVAWAAKVKEWNSTHSRGSAEEFFAFLGLAGK